MQEEGSEKFSNNTENLSSKQTDELNIKLNPTNVDISVDPVNINIEQNITENIESNQSMTGSFSDLGNYTAPSETVEQSSTSDDLFKNSANNDLSNNFNNFTADTHNNLDSKVNSPKKNDEPAYDANNIYNNNLEKQNITNENSDINNNSFPKNESKQNEENSEITGKNPSSNKLNNQNSTQHINTPQDKKNFDDKENENLNINNSDASDHKNPKSNINQESENNSSNADLHQENRVHEHHRNVSDDTDYPIKNYRKNNLGNRRNLVGDTPSSNSNDSQAKKSDNEDNNKSKDNNEKKDEKQKNSSDDKEKNVSIFDTVINSVTLVPKILLVSAIVVIVFIITFMFNFTGIDTTGDQSTGIVDRSPEKSSYKCEVVDTAATGDFSIHYTPLTREEFIEKVNAYQGASSERCSTAQVKAAYRKLADNAGKIYDLGMMLNINPEIVFLRADAEGYSPSCMSAYSGYNNFWGLGCYNGKDLSTCSKFNTLDLGIYNEDNPNSMSFYNWIIRHITTSGTYSETFGTYAQIGTQWTLRDGFRVTDGGIRCSNWGLGGCCYSRYVEKHLVNLGLSSRADAIKDACEVTKKDIPTRKKVSEWSSDDNMDQRAYSMYQTENILKIRKKIFDLGADETITLPCSEKIITLDYTGLLNNENLSDLKGQSFTSFLATNQNNVTYFNRQLLDVINESGPGTRKAVINAGIFLANTFAAYNLRVPYMYTGGGAKANSSQGKQVSYPNESYYGINPYFGETLSYPITWGEKSYPYSGLDCSGFVGWAFHNGGTDFPTITTAYYINEPDEYHLNLIDFDDTLNVIIPGDVLVKNDGNDQHHAALIIDYSDNPTDPYLVVLEEVGKGLSARKYNMNNQDDLTKLNKYKVAHMDYWYDNAPSGSGFSEKFNNGLIGED